MLFVPIGMLMKNNLSAKRIIAAFNELVERITGMLLLGAAGGGPGAAAMVKGGTTSYNISAALHC